MATRNDIKSTILKVAGDPVSGPIRALADQMADAVWALDNSSAETPDKVKPVRGTVQQVEKETRVMGAVEQR
jgi:hypothetical protein